MRVKQVGRRIPKRPIKFLSVGLRKEEASARPKPKYVAKLDRHAAKSKGSEPRLVKKATPSEEE